MARALFCPRLSRTWPIIVGLALPLALFSLVVYRSWDAAVAASDRSLISTVRLLSAATENALLADRLVILQVERATAGKPWEAIAHSADLHADLDAMGGSLHARILLVDQDGHVVASSQGQAPVPPAALAGSRLFQALRHPDGGLSVDQEELDGDSQAPQCVVGLRHAATDTPFGGVVAIVHPGGCFHDVGTALGDVPGKLALIDDRGGVVPLGPTRLEPARTPSPDVMAQIPRHEPIILSAFPAAGDPAGWRAVYQRLPDEPLIVAYAAPLPAATEWGQTVIAFGVPLAAAAAIMVWLAIRNLRRESVLEESLTRESGRRQQAETVAQKAKRLEAIGMLTAGAAHDFNNLLTVISGNLELLRDRRGQEWTTRVEGALSAVTRGAGLVRQMLTFARRQDQGAEQVEINSQLRELAPLIRSALTRDIAIDYRLTEESLVCLVDRVEFELAVLNISANAGHAMPGGGTFRIETGATRLEDVDAARLRLTPGRYARISFADTGEGMPDEVLARAFDSFFSTREPGIGSGLGLSQVHGFARQSDGLATLSSTLGEGTTATIYLPLVKPLPT